jgi:predicted F0F1-ATPase subunit
MTPQPDTSDTGRRSDPRASLRRDLRRYARREPGVASFWQSLSVLGSVGWPIVLATAGGALAGRWLHARWSTSIWLTLVLVVAGAVVGMVIMWQLIQPRRR